MILFYHIWLKTVSLASSRNMERRGGKREGAGRKKLLALAKITREINKINIGEQISVVYISKIAFSRPGEMFVRSEP